MGRRVPAGGAAGSRGGSERRQTSFDRRCAMSGSDLTWRTVW
jgi:hypothetical protein